MDDRIVVHYSSSNSTPICIQDDDTLISLCAFQMKQQSQERERTREERKARKQRQTLQEREDRYDQENQANQEDRQRAEERQRLAEQNWKQERETNVIRLDDGVIVKYRNVSIEECCNQVEARKLLDPKIVVIPEVYRCFSKESRYYLVMESIEGNLRYLVEDDESIQKVARIIHHLQTHEGKIPGPLCEGMSRGIFWEHEYVELGSTARLEMYISRRMTGELKGQSFEVDKLVLNHNDIAPRNIIWMPDGRICLIDWAHAGYYPRLFEMVVSLNNTEGRKDVVFAHKVQIELARSLTDREISDVNNLSHACFNGLRYAMQVF